MTLGLGLIGVALLCAVAFVAAVVRADARVHAVDPAATSGLRGWVLGWLVVSVGSCAAGVLLLLRSVVTAW